MTKVCENGDVVVQNIKNWNFKKASRIEVGEEEEKEAKESAPDRVHITHFLHIYALNTQ